MSESGLNIQGDSWAEQGMEAHFIDVLQMLMLNISFNISKEDLITKLAAESTWLYLLQYMTPTREISTTVMFEEKELCLCVSLSL